MRNTFFKWGLLKYTVVLFALNVDYSFWIPFSLLRCLNAVCTAVVWSKLFSPIDGTHFISPLIVWRYQWSDICFQAYTHLTKRGTKHLFKKCLFSLQKKWYKFGSPFEIDLYIDHSTRVISAFSWSSQHQRWIRWCNVECKLCSRPLLIYHTN